MSPSQVDSAFKAKWPVLGKGQHGYIVNLTGDGRPVFATTLDTNGIGRCLNFQDVSPINPEPEADQPAPSTLDTPDREPPH